MTWQIYLVIAIVAAILLFQYYLSNLAKRSLGLPAPDTTAVDGAVHNMPRRLYYFYATHCHNCKAMTPIVDQLCVTHSNLVKINVDDAKDIASGFRIVGTPSFALVEDGHILEMLLGSQSEKKLTTMLDAGKR